MRRHPWMAHDERYVVLYDGIEQIAECISEADAVAIAVRASIETSAYFSVRSVLTPKLLFQFKSGIDINGGKL